MVFKLNCLCNNEIFNNRFINVEDLCTEFNDFILIFFLYLKFAYVLVLIIIGILTLLKLKGLFLKINKNNISNEENRLKKLRLILGWIYIFMGFGILFNYFTLFLIWLLDPLPDRLIFRFLKLGDNINPETINRIEDLENLKNPHEKTIFYCFALASFFFSINLILNIWYLINNNRVISKPKSVILNLMGSIMGVVMFGFTTYMPFLL